MQYSLHCKFVYMQYLCGSWVGVLELAVIKCSLQLLGPLGYFHFYSGLYSLSISYFSSWQHFNLLKIAILCYVVIRKSFIS